VCVAAAGNQACPAGYPTPYIVFTGLIDTRVCSPCTCGAPALACDIVAVVTDSSGCPGGGTVFYGDDTCYGVSAGPVGSIDLTVESPCAPGGGQPAGSVQVEDPITVCCR
jgi:hypothetical protein